MRMVAQGLPNGKVSPCLGVSRHTVKTQLFRVHEKPGVLNRAEQPREAMAPWTNFRFLPLEIAFINCFLAMTCSNTGISVLSRGSFNLDRLVNINFRRLLKRYLIEDLTMDNLARYH